MTEHCHHKEAAGCDYCIRKYHFHLTNTVLLTESDLDDIIKKASVPAEAKFKSRNLQEAAVDYLRHLRNNLTSWLDQAEKAIMERLTYPLLAKNNLLPTYQRLKHREYRKVNAK